MKPQKIILIITSLFLAACGNSELHVTDTSVNIQQETVSTTAAITTVVTTEETELSSTTPAVTITAEETVIEQTTAEVYDWNGFILSEHCGEFDEAEPLKYHSWKYDDQPEIDETRLNSAYQAVIESKYYNEVIEFGKSYLEWNGSDFVTGEKDFNFLLKNFPDYIDYEAAPDLVLKPKFINCIQLPFDGVNIEEIMLFSFPLAESEIEWSGTSLMYIAVYVNADGEARVIYEVSDQTLSTQINPIEYSDGMIHLEFGSGHTSGTSRSTILSFSNGEYKVEYEGIAVHCDEDGFVMRDDISAFFEHNILLFRDGLRNCYCELKRVPLSDEISRAILAD